MKQKILITRSLFPDVVERLKQYFDVTVNDGAKYTSSQLADALKDMDGLLLAGGEKVDASVIKNAPRLKAVCVTAAGFNSVDVEALTKAGIMVTNAPGPADNSVADFTWGLMIASARKLTEGERYVREGHWKASVVKKFFGFDVHNKVLGILGMGRIGQAIAKRAVGFEMKVLYHNRNRVAEKIEQECKANYVSKETLLQESDFIVLALPYTKNNHHIISKNELELMQSSAIIVNIARGGLIDEVALAEALKQHKIAGAALDVFEQEPKVYPALFDLPNVILTPHIAGGTYETQHGLANVGADNLIAALGHGPDAFHPKAILNPEVLKR